MNSSSPVAVIAVGLAATLLFGMGLATHVTQNVVALSQEEDDERNGGFDLKDWCAISLEGDILTIRAEGVTQPIDVGDARGSLGRPLTTGAPGTTDGPVGRLVRVAGAVESGHWVARVVNVKQQQCRPDTGEPSDRPDRALAPGTPTATRAPGRLEETRTPREDATRVPGRPTDAPGRGPDGTPGQGQGQDNDNRGRGRD